MKIIFDKYGGLKTIEDRQLLVQSSSNANYVDIYYQDENGNFADEAVNLATIAFKRADSFEIMEKTCDAVREELTNKLLYFRYVFQEDDLAVNGELQITVRLKQVVFDPEDETQILLIKQRAMGKLVAHIYEAIGTDYEYYNVIDGRLLQLELWQSTFDGNFYDVTQIDAIVAQEVLNRNNAINDHNNNANAHASIREKIATNTDNIATNDERISELEGFRDGLNIDIGNQINQAVAVETNAREELQEAFNNHQHSYDEIIDKPVSVIFEITSFTKLTPLQKTTITNQLMPLLNDNLTDLDTNKYSDLILRYLDERYHYSSVAVIDGEVVRILFDYKNEDTKIKLDINFVGDDSQTVIELVTINYELEGTVSTHNTSETAHSGIRQKVDEAKAIAEGKSRARVFATESALNTWLSNPENVASLQIGDHFYIEETDKPDYWWNGTTIKELETQKVDLTEYAKKTELLTLGTTENDAYRGDLGQIAYNHSQSAHAPSNAQKNSDITKAEIEEKLTGEISSHSHALPSHTHDDRYYTEKEVNTKLGGKANATHNHTKSEITDFPTIPTIPDITVNNGDAESGKYISQIAVDATNKHKLIVTKADLPQGFSGDYEDLTNVPDEFTPTAHNHDSDYYKKNETYTKTEIDAMFDNLLGGSY